MQFVYVIIYSIVRVTLVRNQTIRAAWTVFDVMLSSAHSVRLCSYFGVVGWCDGPWLTSSAGASNNLDDSRSRAYCACSRCGLGLFWTVLLSSIFSLLFIPLFGRRPDIDWNTVSKESKTQNSQPIGVGRFRIWGAKVKNIGECKFPAGTWHRTDIDAT